MQQPHTVAAMLTNEQVFTTPVVLSSFQVIDTRGSANGLGVSIGTISRLIRRASVMRSLNLGVERHFPKKIAHVTVK